MAGLILCWAAFAVVVGWSYLNLRRAADRYPRRRARKSANAGHEADRPHRSGLS